MYVYITAIAVAGGSQLTREAGMGRAILDPRNVLHSSVSNVIPGVKTLSHPFQYPFLTLLGFFLYLANSGHTGRKQASRTLLKKYFKHVTILPSLNLCRVGVLC